MRNITMLDSQHAHRLYGFEGEAQCLHRHIGILTLEVGDTMNASVNVVFPCNEIQRTVWEVLESFDHAMILRGGDSSLPALLEVYEAQSIKDGAPNNIMKGSAFRTDPAIACPECRLVVTKETVTVGGMIKIVYNLLKDKLSIVKITSTSGVNAASEGFKPQRTMERCLLCGIALDENGVCLKRSYRKQNWYGKREAGMI